MLNLYRRWLIVFSRETADDQCWICKKLKAPAWKFDLFLYICTVSMDMCVCRVQFVWLGRYLFKLPAKFIPHVLSSNFKRGAKYTDSFQAKSRDSCVIVSVRAFESTPGEVGAWNIPGRKLVDAAICCPLPQRRMRRSPWWCRMAWLDNVDGQVGWVILIKALL